MRTRQIWLGIALIATGVGLTFGSFTAGLSMFALVGGLTLVVAGDAK